MIIDAVIFFSTYRAKQQWVDSKKPIFQVEIVAATTVHALDNYLDPFLNLTSTLQLGENVSGRGPNFNIGSRSRKESSMEENLLRR